MSTSAISNVQRRRYRVVHKVAAMANGWGLIVARQPVLHPVRAPTYTGPLFKGFLPDELVLNIMRLRVPASPEVCDASFPDFQEHSIIDYQRYMRELAINRHYEAMAREAFFRHYRHLHMIQVQGLFDLERDGYDPMQKRFKPTPIPASYCAQVQRLHVAITIGYNGAADDAIVRETVMRLESTLALFTSVRRVLISVDTLQPVQLTHRLDRHILRTVFDVLGPAMESKKRGLGVCLALKYRDGLSNVILPSTVAWLHSQGDQGWDGLEWVLDDAEAAQS